MVKEELEKEAEKSFEQYKVTDEDYVVSPYSDDMGEKMLMYNYEYYAEETYSRFYIQGYLAGAESREKQIEIDARQIRALQKQNGELTDKVAELKKQLGNLYEIIKRPYQFTAPRKIQIVEEAEQFLKEEQNVFNQ